MESKVRLFISHSSKDSAIAEALIDLIQNALNLPASEIRCTSVDGYRLPGGADTNQQIRDETLCAEAFIGLVSVSSIQSMYVAFELGARWGAKKHLLPILAPGFDASTLDAPLTGLNALSCESSSQLHQMIDELAKHLKITQASPAVYERYIDRILNLDTRSSFKAPIQQGWPGSERSGAPGTTGLWAPCGRPQSPGTGFETSCHNNATKDSPNSIASTPFSSMLARLKLFDSESGKIQHILDSKELLKDKFSYSELISLLSQFKSDNNKLQVTESVRAFLAQPSDQDLDDIMALFSSETTKKKAFKIVT